MFSLSIPFKVPLRQFSGWLSDFDAATNRIEIPGQYIQTSCRAPNVENHAMLGKEYSSEFIASFLDILHSVLTWLLISVHFYYYILRIHYMISDCMTRLRLFFVKVYHLMLYETVLDYIEFNHVNLSISFQILFCLIVPCCVLTFNITRSSY